MAGRPEISAKKIHNMGLGKLEHACSEIVHQYMSENHPLSLGKDDEKAMHALADLSTPEWQNNMMGYQRLLVTKLIHRAIREVEKMKDGSVHTALKYAMDTLRELQGDSSQHVTQAKKGLTPEQMEELLRELPKKAKQVDE